MRRVFKDDALEANFQEYGYTIIPFLEEAEVEDLIQTFFNLLPQSGGNILADETGVEGMSEITYDFTFIDKNVAYKQRVFDEISARFKLRYQNILADYKPIIANFIRKVEGGGEVPLHQNWAFLDESKYSSVTIWCPLVDSNEENGTLQLVPKSHKRFGEFRGPMVPWELNNIQKEIINKHMLPVSIKAGQAIVLDDSIIHYSNINKTSGLRLAIQLIMIPSGVQSLHYHMNPNVSQEKIDVLEVNRDFYMQFNPWKQPQGIKKINTIPFQSKMLTENEFLVRLKEARIDQKPTNLISKIKHLFTN